MVDNSIDEALACYAKTITVTINEDNSITVVDDGRGIPADFHEKEQKSALEVVLTVLHAAVSSTKGILQGVGRSARRRCIVCKRTPLHLFVPKFTATARSMRRNTAAVKPTTELQIIGESDHTGTMVTFKPDASIFTVTEYDYTTLATVCATWLI